MKALFSLTITLFLLSAPLWGGDSFKILSGEGAAFTLTRGELVQEYDINSSDLSLLSVEEGDYLSTGESTFLELSSLQGDLFIMVGENSSLYFDSLDVAQGSLITLSYGHLHGYLSGEIERNLWVSGLDTVCQLAAGDFGFHVEYDMTLDQPVVLSKIYSLGGAISVMQRKDWPIVDSSNKRIEYREPLTIGKGEMVKTSSWERDLPLVTLLFDFDYAQYWKVHPFSFYHEPVPEPIILEVVTPETNFPINEGATLGINQNRTNFIVAGRTALIVGTALITSAFASYAVGEGELGNTLVGLSCFNFAVGAGSLGYAATLPPQVPLQ